MNRPVLRNFFQFFFILLLLFGTIGASPFLSKAEQVLPSIDDLIVLMLKNQKNVYRFYVETENRVFFPKDINDLQSEFVRKPENDFRQRILYIRDNYLGILTSDLKGKHFYLYMESDYQNNTKKVNLEDPENKRIFSELDIFPHYVYWFSKFKKNYLKKFDKYGINHSRINYAYKNSKIYYHIGSEKNYALLNFELYRIEELNLQWGEGSGAYNLRIKSENFHRKYFKIPETVRYYLNDSLIKISQVKKIQFKGLAKIRNEFDQIRKQQFQ